MRPGRFGGVDGVLALALDGARLGGLGGLGRVGRDTEGGGAGSHQPGTRGDGPRGRLDGAEGRAL